MPGNDERDKERKESAGHGHTPSTDEPAYIRASRRLSLLTRTVAVLGRSQSAALYDTTRVTVLISRWLRQLIIHHRGISIPAVRARSGVCGGIKLSDTAR